LRGYLLDTHTLIWWFMDSPSIGRAARAQLADGEGQVFVSAASAFEIATKHRIGKLPQVGALIADYAGHLARQNFGELPVTADHGLRAGALPIVHRDPFDRMLIAQALAEDLVLLSNEQRFDATGVARIWD
jgi:PIN domain nuclease of toxin-antitoxin system